MSPVRANLRCAHKYTAVAKIFYCNSIKLRTWEDASDECCARGGHLATFLDQDFVEEFQKCTFKRTSKFWLVYIRQFSVIIEVDDYWIGALSVVPGTYKTVWCVPGENDVSDDKSPLDSMVQNFKFLKPAGSLHFTVSCQ